MWDRQFLSSLAITLVAGAGAVGILAGIVLWLGWTGVLGLLAMVGGFVVWFYCGPRPDLRASPRGPGRPRADHE